MNSKQLNFFIVKEDYGAIQNFFDDNFFATIIIKDGGVKEVISYSVAENREKLFQVFLSRENQPNIFFQPLEKKPFFYIDILRSECIEFSLGGFYPGKNKELRSGRLYFITKYFIEGNELVPKSDAFVKQATLLLKQFEKKFLVKSKHLSGVLLSKNALNWVNENGAKLNISGDRFVASLAN